MEQNQGTTEIGNLAIDRIRAKLMDYVRAALTISLT
jgi:hypothetical protein